MTSNTEPAYLVYSGRYRTYIRVAAVLFFTGVVVVSKPAPSLHGHGLVILVSLVVAATTQLAAVILPSRWALGRATISCLGAAVLSGFDSSGSVALLIFAGLDAGAMLDIRPGTTLIAGTCVTQALATLASGLPATNVAEALGAVAGFLAANTVKQHRLRVEEAELRAADAERAAEEHALAVRLAERANAAREIHDILAHSLGALVLQLDAVDALLDAEPPDVKRARPLVARSRLLAAEGLTEARRAVGTLRQDPLPIVDGLRQLIETTGSGTLEVVGDPRQLPADISLAVRRTAQEGLTNAAKHAAGSHPVVRLHFDPSQVVLSVTDTGPAPGQSPTPIASTGGGYGIEGLRERARLLGGSLTAGPTHGGWEVRLQVPVL